MTSKLRLGTLLGVRFTAGWSFLAITGLLALGLAKGLLPAEAPGEAAPWYWIAGIATAIAFVAAVGLHELAHALAARRQGIEVKAVTLWMLGGHTELNESPSSPRAELRISSAGPTASLVLGAVLAGVAWAAHQSGSPRLAVLSLAWLGSMNILLAALNLLPASPLDGGKLLHSVVWKLSGDRARASSVASRSGQVVGWVMAASGFVALAAGYLAGVWLAFTGWMIAAAAAAEGRQEAARSALEGLSAADVMLPAPVRLPAWLTVQAVVDDKLVGLDRPALPIESWGGEFAGVVAVDQLAAVPEDRRRSVRVQDVAWPAAVVPTVAPSTPASDVLIRLQGGAPWAVVVAPQAASPTGDGNDRGDLRPIGLVSAYELANRIASYRRRATVGRNGQGRAA